MKLKDIDDQNIQQRENELRRNVLENEKRQAEVNRKEKEFNDLTE